MRGQAAVELLMTYGWALLIAIVLVGLLYQFGLISALAGMVQGSEEVLGFGSFSASAFVRQGGNLSLQLTNVGGGDVIVQYVSVGGTILSSPSPPFPINVSRGASVTVNGTTGKINGSFGSHFGPVTLEIGFDTPSHAGHKDSAMAQGWIQPR